MATASFDIGELESLIGRKLEKKDYGQIPMLGTPLEARDEKTITIEVFPNRPELLSIEGFARALKGFLGTTTGLKQYPTKKSGTSIIVERSVQGIRPYIGAAIVRKVRLDEGTITAFMQTQEKLHETLGRKRKKVAIGAHNLAPVAQPFHYKAVRPESKSFVPLDSKEKMSLEEILEKHPKGRAYASVLEGCEKYPIIEDRTGQVLSFPPIINGELTRVTQRTKELLVEVTGTDKKAIGQALNIICTAFADRGYAIETIKIAYPEGEETTPDLSPEEKKLGLEYCNRLLGLGLTPKEAEKLLEKMGYGVAKAGKDIAVLVPAYRTDIMHPIDIVEDIAIAHGYMEFKPRIAEVATTGSKDRLESFCEKLREICIGLGLTESMTFLLTNPEKEYARTGAEEKKEAVKIANPRTPDFTHFRTSLIPSLLETIAKNSHHELPQKIFEIGDTATADPRMETGAAQKRLLAVAIVHEKANYNEARSHLEAILKELGQKELKTTPVNNASYIEGRAAEISAGKARAIIGETHPRVLKNFGIEYPVSVFELDIDGLFKGNL